MQLAEQHIEIFRRWLKEHQVSTKCESCAQTPHWNIGTDMVYHIKWPISASPNANAYLTLVSLTCQYCGHVRLYNARNVGIYPENWTENDKAGPKMKEW